MSKELEALKRIVNEISNYKLHGLGDENWLGIQDVLKDIDTIENAITPPTEQEVCEELSEELGVPVYYNQPHRYFYYEVLDIAERNKREIIICTFTKRSQNHKKETLQIKYDFTPHIITLIGRFYEGKVKE